MVKLIKLQGDSDKSDTQIRNIFNDGIIVPPNSKIGLRSCRVNFLNIQDFENFTLPTDTTIEVDYHVGDVSGSSPPMFVQKVVVPSKDASGNVIEYESAGQLLRALSKQSNATYTDESIVRQFVKYQGFHNIWDLTVGTLDAGRSEFLTYSLADRNMAFAKANSQFVKQSPDSDTNIELLNGAVGITASAASPLADNLNVEGQLAIPLVNTVMTGDIAVLPANDPHTGDDCFVFAAKKGSGELSSHPVLWGWGISKDHNTDRRYAMWVNGVKYFFPDSTGIVPQVDDQIQCRKLGDRVKFSVTRGGTNLPLALAAAPVASTAGSAQLTVTVPSGSGAHVGSNVTLSGLANIERPAQALVTDGVATSASPTVNIASNGVSVTQAQVDPIVTVTTAVAELPVAGDAFTLGSITGFEANLISTGGVEVTNIQPDPVVKVTTAAVHGLVVGSTFTMSGVTQTPAGPATIGGIPIADFNGVVFTVSAVDSTTVFKYIMTGKTSSDAASSGAGGKVNHTIIGGLPISDFNGFSGTVLASPAPSTTSFSFTLTGKTSTAISTGGGVAGQVTGVPNALPLTLTFADAHHLITGETFTMVSAVAVDGVAIGAGSTHTVASAPNTTTITIAMPSGQRATTGGVTGGGGSMTIKADLVMISSVFLNKSHVITGVPTATTITIAHDTGGGATALLFSQTGGGASGKAQFPTQSIGSMLSGSNVFPAQSGTVPVLTSDSLDPQVVRWQVTADKACGFKVGGSNSASLTYQATDGFGQAAGVGNTINTTLTFPRNNPIGSYIGFTDSVYSNIGAPSVITSDQPAIGRNAYPAILVQSLKGLNLDSYAGVQDSPNKPISFFDVIVPQSVSTISNMIYEPNNIAMLDLHNARPIELKDMEVQFARDDTGKPLQFFGNPTVILELEEGSD